jgi:hypothetical protein
MRVWFLVVLATMIPGQAQGRAVGLGVGVLLGEPVAFSIAYRPDERQSIQMLQGWSFGQKRMHAGIDYLYTPTEIPADETLGLRYPVYVGVGLRGRFFGTSTTAAQERGNFGLRFPVGVGVEPEHLPLEVYFEMAPVWVVAPVSHGGFDGAIGARLYF